MQAGPPGAGGTMCAIFYVRDEGRVAQSVRVVTFADDDGLSLVVYSPTGETLFEHRTQR